LKLEEYKESNNLYLLAVRRHMVTPVAYATKQTALFLAILMDGASG